MFEYMTVQEAAQKWGISERRIQILCNGNRIDGVIRLSRVWLIPNHTKKPPDGRRKKSIIDTEKASKKASDPMVKTK